MIKYLCDVENCGKEAKCPDGEAWSDKEMVDLQIEGASYFWARIGFLNITLCSEHRREAVKKMIESLNEKYNLRNKEK